MNASIRYSLSPAGQKAHILAGGDGKNVQTIEVGRDDPDFARLLARGTVGADGNVLLNRQYAMSYDAPQTAASILDDLDAQDREEAERKAKAGEQKRLETLAVLTERRTRNTQAQVSVDRAGKVVIYGGVAHASYTYGQANWPYDADSTVRGSDEAKAWEAELEVAKTASHEAALAEAKAKLPAILEAEQKAAQDKEEKAVKLIARKEAMGGAADDYLCRIESGAFANVPLYSSHKRSKCWLATVTVSPSSPGGLSRDFAAKARGEGYYMVPSLSVGDAVEFGADTYSGSGRKSPERWYGFVVAVTEDAVLIRPCAGGKSACKAGTKFVGAKIAKDA
jgi:hypothetical protein